MNNDKEGALSSSTSSIGKRSKKKSKASKLKNEDEDNGAGGGEGKTKRRMKKKESSSSLASGKEADGSLSPSKLIRKTSKNKSPAASETSLSSIVSPVETRSTKKKKKKKKVETPQFSSPPVSRKKSAASSRFNGHKSLGDMSGLSQSSHSQVDNNSSTSLGKSSGPVRPLGPIVYDDLPDPRDLMKKVTDDVRALKFEAKSQFKLMEESKKQCDEAVNKAKLEHKKQQVARLKGNELMRVDHLLRLGFDAEVLREHMDKANKALENDVKKSQSEKQNLSSNIEKMKQMNEQSEQAVAAATGAIGSLIVKQQTLEAKLEKVELELYTLETRAKHRRNMRSVEVVGKDKYKAAMKAVVRKMEQKCQDPDLVRKILKIAEKPLSTDLGLSSDDDDDDDRNGGGMVSDDDDDDDDDSDDSSYDLNGSNKAGSAAAIDDDDDDDSADDSADDSSVSVSSVRSDESDEDEESD